MDELVTVRSEEVVCSSLDVAEMFEKRHDRVLRAIESIIVGIPKDGVSEKMFKASTYSVEGNNKRYPMYYMNRDGFSLLAMGFTGKKALEWKLRYIEAFNNMESMLRERNTQLWIEQRQHGKITRKAETDVIQNLVEYASNQGSTHSKMLYMTYSKLANKMAGITDRDFATFQQLNELSFIENIIMNQIRVGMEREMHYKDIYRDCKRQIELFKDIAYLEAG